MAESFQTTYQQLTNRPYHNSPKTYDSLEELQANEPTILLQIVGHAVSNKRRSNDSPRIAASLNPQYPLDILLAIPPEHYFEWNGKSYKSRFYVDERGSNSIMGANALMGHDVLFDLDNRRLGIAESTCNYTAVTSEFPIPPPTLPNREDRAYDASSEALWCSTRSCQHGLLILPCMIVVYFARRILRGRPHTYEALGGNEDGLELEENPSLGNANGYRDERDP